MQQNRFLITMPIFVVQIPTSKKQKKEKGNDCDIYTTTG